MLNRYINRQNVYIVDKPMEKHELFTILSKKALELGYISDADALVKSVEEKEEAAVMELKPHIVLPHGRGDFINKLFVFIAAAKEEVKYKGAKKSKMKLAIYIGIPRDNKEYLKLLASISRLMQKDEFVDKLLKSHVPDDIVYTVKKYATVEARESKLSTKKYLVFLSLNKYTESDKIAPLLTEIGIDLPTEIEGKNLGNASNFLPFLSAFGFGAGLSKYNRTYFGLTDEKEAGAKLYGLLKMEGIDLNDDGVGSLFQIEVMESYGGFAEDLEF